jgi:flagellin FlaB
MFNRFVKAIKRLHTHQAGITGLETAIILIAFVTVASVLAYSVLSAGIFSSERGKETVYGGLESAQSTLELKGSVIAESALDLLTDVTFTIALAIDGTQVDTGSLVVNYWDADEKVMGTTDFTVTLSAGCTERGSATILEGDEQFVVAVDITTIAATSAPGPYDTFTIQIIPPTGASLTVQRTLPGGLTAMMSLN